VAADFNRDGIVDLAAAATHGGGIEIHLGEGAGRFAPARHVITGARPFHMITAALSEPGVAKPHLATGLAVDAHGTFYVADGTRGFLRIRRQGGSPQVLVGATTAPSGFAQEPYRNRQIPSPCPSPVGRGTG